ncbi:septal ring lytic transglycosylase RlpA family protein [Bradyrhizobium sp. 2]|uniref:septal ring lytic transglycosylase RlpA family protein n=1 Tax=Bradyrhizobium TaxID=374 RepID=UPI0004AD7759|nr:MULTISPECIES: septal ring lytic transglycosylase RlpA family protein [Bradyrhizobium]MCK1441512.1 septal ring lytic transglycosylase RlpA family protein [Bradyrhizobium sp. 48]MCK1460230.1 septal ring lytic transglycosylase RlpA family protein [Bradyrhizobium sp. 2]
MPRKLKVFQTSQGFFDLAIAASSMKAAASGTTFDRDSLTAAHRNLPLGTHVRVTDPKSSKSVVVRITDRGPWIRSRVIDLSLAAARSLGFTNRGVAQVRAEVL